MLVLSNPLSQAEKPQGKVARVRDGRLDFFRGLAMFIIFIAHMPENWWIKWIPARFGFSDATEIFVFCSGMASALAFGFIFQTRGLLIGTARVLHRIWQVYWAHICLFFIIAFLHVSADKLIHGGQDDYLSSLNLDMFFDHARDGLLGLLTLTYVPNYLDILPMYIGILALLPLMFALRRISIYLFAAASFAMWLLANFSLLELPADPWDPRGWFFNPFAWQAIFFTGFALMLRDVKAPPIDKRLLIAAGAFLILSIPFSWHKIVFNVPRLEAAYHAIEPLTDKSHFGILRYIHFLCLAYIANAIVVRLGARFSGRFVRTVQLVGQQSLGVFLSSLVLAQLASISLDLAGRNSLTVPLANFAGFGGLILVARTVAWFKSTPWKKEPAQKTNETPASAVVAVDRGMPKQTEQKVFIASKSVR